MYRKIAFATPEVAGEWPNPETQAGQSGIGLRSIRFKESIHDLLALTPFAPSSSLLPRTSGPRPGTGFGCHSQAFHNDPDAPGRTPMSGPGRLEGAHAQGLGRAGALLESSPSVSSPADIAAVALFLTSDEAKSVSGTPVLADRAAGAG